MKYWMCPMLLWLSGIVRAVGLDHTTEIFGAQRWIAKIFSFHWFLWLCLCAVRWAFAISTKNCENSVECHRNHPFFILLFFLSFSFPQTQMKLNIKRQEKSSDDDDDVDVGGGDGGVGPTDFSDFNNISIDKCLPLNTNCHLMAFVAISYLQYVDLQQQKNHYTRTQRAHRYKNWFGLFCLKCLLVCASYVRGRRQPEHWICSKCGANVTVLLGYGELYMPFAQYAPVAVSHLLIFMESNQSERMSNTSKSSCFIAVNASIAQT